MERLVVIRPDGSEFRIGPLADAAPLAHALLTDTDCYGVRIERGHSVVWESLRGTWAELARLTRPEDFEEIDDLEDE